MSDAVMESAETLTHEAEATESVESENESEQIESEDEGESGFQPTQNKAKPDSGKLKEKSGQKMSAKETEQALKELADGDLDKVVTVKINGKIEKKPVREVLKLAQLNQSATEKFQQASQLSKRAEAAFKMATENPEEFLRRTGKDPYEFAEAILARKFEEMNLTPEERKLREREAKVKQFEEQENLSKQDMISKIKSLVPEFNVDLGKVSKEQLQSYLQQAEEFHQKEQNSLQEEIVKAWSSSGLPKDKFFGAQIAARMLSSQKQANAGNREKPLSAEEAAVIVKDEWIGNTRRILETMDAQAILQVLGDKIPKALREFDVKRVTGKQPLDTNKSPGPQPASNKKSKPLTELQWRAQIEEMSKNFAD